MNNRNAALSLVLVFAVCCLAVEHSAARMPRRWTPDGGDSSPEPKGLGKAELAKIEQRRAAILASAEIEVTAGQALLKLGEHRIKVPSSARLLDRYFEQKIPTLYLSADHRYPLALAVDRDMGYDGSYSKAWIVWTLNPNVKNLTLALGDIREIRPHAGNGYYEIVAASGKSLFLPTTVNSCDDMPSSRRCVCMMVGDDARAMMKLFPAKAALSVEGGGTLEVTCKEAEGTATCFVASPIIPAGRSLNRWATLEGPEASKLMAALKDGFSSSDGLFMWYIQPPLEGQPAKLRAKFVVSEFWQ